VFFAYKYKGRESRREGQQKEEKKKKRRDRKHREKERKNREQKKKYRDKAERPERVKTEKKKRRRRRRRDWCLYTEKRRSIAAAATELPSHRLHHCKPLQMTSNTLFHSM
jgi:hypothetical protein